MYRNLVYYGSKRRRDEDFLLNCKIFAYPGRGGIYFSEFLVGGGGGGGGCNARLSKPCLCVRPKYLISRYPFPALVPVVQRADNFIQWISHYPAVQMYSKQRFWQVFHTIPYLACVAVVSLSFQPSGASTKDARGHWEKRSKKTFCSVLPNALARLLLAPLGLRKRKRLLRRLSNT